MKVSVVIPAYNEEKYIGSCLESLMHQQEAADEIIVVDNNSTDNTAKIARKFGVRVIGEKRQGMTPARNTGFDAARHEIIARSDADNKLPPYWIKKIKKNFSSREIDALTGPIVYGDFLLKTASLSQLYSRLVKLIIGSEVLLGMNYMLTKRIWEKAKQGICWDDKLVHEDIDLSMNILRVGGKIYKDQGLIINTSARRIKYNRTYWTDYPVRLVKSLALYNYGRRRKV